MTAKQYLSNYKRIEGRYKTAIEEYRMIENDMVSLKSPSFEERVQTSSKNDPIGDIVIKLEMKKGKIGLDIVKYRTQMITIRNQIDEIENIDNEYHLILVLRYILNKDWKFICDSMSVSRAQANKVHGKALVEFDKIFGEKYKEN